MMSSRGNYRSTLTDEFLLELGNLNKGEYYRRITKTCLDTILESLKQYDSSIKDIVGKKVIIIITPGVTYYFIPIGKSQYEWWKFTKY